MSFWKELSRRNVVKVGTAYAVAAWLIIHPVDIIFPILHLPEWSITLVTAFLIIGFPFVLIFSWVYEVTPKGLKKTKDVPLSKSTTHVTGRKLNYIIIGLLVLAVVLLVFDNFYLGRHTTMTEQVPAVSDVAKSKKTIAVLPFENLSSDPEQKYFVDGLSEEILNSLCQISDLNVIAKTSSFAFKGTNKSIQEIAGILGVDNILEGSVRKAGNELRITAQLIRAVDGVHLWSKIYDRKLKDIFAIQEDIGTAVADELKATLGIGKSLKKLGGTDSLEAYELYLDAKGLMYNSGTSWYKTYKSIETALDSAIALDPKFALAWAQKSYNHFLLAIFGPPDKASVEQSKSLEAAQKAIELEPNLVDAYNSLSAAIESRGDFIESRLTINKALELKKGQLSGFDYSIGGHFYNVGHFKKAIDIFEGFRTNDPLNKDVRAYYMLTLGLLGNLRQAEEEYERGRALFGDQWSLGDSYITLLRINSKGNISIDNIVWSDAIFDAAKKHLYSSKDGLAEMHRIYLDIKNLSSAELIEISLWAAYFGDTDFAMEAIEKGLRIDATGIFQAWVPVMKEVRQTPRFKAFVKKIGLVDYWNKFGWPDICHKLDNGDFVCD
jgi:adenylate cyclase